MDKFEYKFVRLKQEGMAWPSKATRDGEDIVHHHANEGWRLVQRFAPSIGVAGQPTYFELILDRRSQQLT
jgi:hypothetical protein